MKIITALQPESTTSLTIELTAEEWQEILNKSATKISEIVEIKGFRLGKAPLDMVINQVGEAKVLSEAAEAAIAKFYGLAVTDQKLIPVMAPKISIVTLALDKPLVFKAEVVVLPAVELGDYRQIKIKPQEIKIDETQIDKTLEGLRRRAAKFNPVDRVSQSGDWMEIDFTGKLDGQPFEGGNSQHHPLIIGDGVLLPDFESALIGLKAGDVKTFEVKFPDDYHQPNLVGKTTQFEVKVHQVKEVHLPEIDDDLAKQTGNLQSLAELKADIAKWLTEDAQKKEETRQQEATISELVKLIKVEVPPVLVVQELDSMLEDLKHQLSHQKVDFEDYLKKNNVTEEKIKQDWQNAALLRIKAGLALDAFKRKENIAATEAEVNADIERLKKMYPSDADKIEAKYQNAEERSRLQNLLSGQKALRQLWQMAIQ